MDFLDSVNVQFQAAYHGSGASFEHFNTTQYGLSGEGSMAFGWGTYLTSSEDIARDYADRQGSQKYADINDSYNVLKTNVFGTLQNAAEMKGFEKAVQERKAALQHQVEDTDGFYSDEQKGNAKRLLEEMENLTENDLKTRHIYSVEIPDGKYLSWNNDVPEATKTEIAEKLHSHLVESDPESYSGNATNYLRQELESLFESEMDGQRFYGSLADYLGSERQASEFLKESGYTGISYPAGTIYGNGNGATNYVIFNDDDIEIKEHLQFQLVGERSIMRMAESEEKERILADLSAAKLMEEKYKNMDAAARVSRIRFATGWEKSADGRWKYELDDSKNRIKSGTLFQKILSTQPQMLEQLTKTTTLTLEDIMEAPELFNVFPFMKNVRVSFYSDPNAFRAVLTPEGIKINTQYLNEVDGEKGMKGVLAHEIQHVIQAVEYSGSKGLHGESIELLYSDMQNAIKAAGSNRYDYDLTSLQEGLDEYMHDFGEVEARNVARRISMSYNERRHNTLESTEDVARNLQFQIRSPGPENRNLALEQPTSRSQYLEGKRELTDEDIIKILDLPNEKPSQASIQSYTRNSYRELKESPEKLAELTEKLKTVEYLKYHDTYIAKSKLLYEQSAVLYNEIPCLIVLNEMKVPAYLLPYEYAKESDGIKREFADSLKNDYFTDFKRVFSSRINSAFKKGIQQGRDIFFLVSNENLDKEEIKRQLIDRVNYHNVPDRSGTYIFFSEKDSKCYSFEVDKKGQIGESTDFDLKKFRLALSDKPLSLGEEINSSSSKNIVTDRHTYVNTINSVSDFLLTRNLIGESTDADLKKIRLTLSDKPLPLGEELDSSSSKSMVTDKQND
ncbi:MAG: hypothetical protein IKQ43_07375, partial [Treponema sp.]|nr:hypothetical protein [Treponema sp.]